MNAANKHSMITRAKAYAEAYANAQQEKKMKEQEHVLEYTIDQFNLKKVRTFALASLALMGSAVFIIKNPLWTKVVQIWYLIFAFKILDSLNNYKPDAPDNVAYTWIIQTVYGKQVKIILDESDDEEEDEEDEEEDDEDDEEEEEDEDEEEEEDDPTDEDYVDKPVIKRPSTKKKATHNNNIAKEIDNDIHIVSTSEMAKADEPNTGLLETSTEPNNDSEPNASTEPNNDSETPSQEPTTNDCASPDTNLSLKIPDAEDYIMAERLSN